RRAMLRPSDRQRCGRKVDLRPLQVANLRSPQTMPECQQDHGLIPVRPAIAPASVDQPLDLAFGEVFACSDIGVLGSARRDFPFYGVWGYDSQDWFSHMKQRSDCSDFRQSNPFTESWQGLLPCA